MYIATLIPTKECHTIDIPEVFYGQEIVVTAQSISSKNSKSDISKTTEIEAIFSKYRQIDLSNFKFDRDEANDFS
ncbi:MAG: hypothetical protein ACKVOU_09385 [Cytophagales bacterium]